MVVSSKHLGACAQTVRAILPVLTVAVLAGCAHIGHQTVSPDEAPTVRGPSVRDNRTPFEPALACLADNIVRQKQPKLTFAVGEIKDYTGKYSINEGNAITQGGALMVYSALGKMGGAIRIVERFDTRIPEIELGYMDKRQLGDGKIHALDPSGSKVVPWIPYFGGSLLRSQYYIVGGITELNYNIQSGGGQAVVNLGGPSARTYTSSVGLDLRLVDTATAQVIQTVSLEKQVVGYEVDAGIFQFFGNTLVNINAGAKNEEPMQLAVRSALEEATVQLVGYAEDLNVQPCLERVTSGLASKQAAALREEPDHRDIAGLPVQVDGAPMAPIVGVAAAGSHEAIIFTFGTDSMIPSASASISRIAQTAAKSPVNVELLAQDSENWDPSKRNDLVSARLSAFLKALSAAGLDSSHVSVVWRPDATDGSIHHDGPGYQKVADLLIR